MSLSTQMLVTKEDCNTLLAIANDEKETLAFRKVSLERHRVTSSGSSISIETDLQMIQAQINVSESIIANIPDGELKNKEKTRLLGYIHRKAVLTDRKNSHGVIAVLQTEYEIDCVEKQIASTDSFIETVKNRLNEL